MHIFKKKAAVPEEPMDLESVMKKYDRESNVRIWEGTPRLIVNLILASFSVFCLYVTLFTSWPVHPLGTRLRPQRRRRRNRSRRYTHL